MANASIDQTVLAPNEAPRTLSVFTSVADQWKVRAAELLSISLALTRGELNNLLATIWEIDRATDLDRIVDDLTEWPFLILGSDGLRLQRNVAKELSIRFQERTPTKFEDAHRALIELEQQKEHDSGIDEFWYSRGRIAYYLAGVASDESARRFGEAFGEPPYMDRRSARIWLTSLVLHQDHLLDDQARILSFYRGFRSYVVADYNTAKEQFRIVVRDTTKDLYRAIALHLLGHLQRPNRPDTAVEHLTESISLSVDLQLIETELFARNTLAFTHLEQAGDLVGQKAKRELKESHQLATLNLRRARQLEGDQGMLGFTKRAAAKIHWLWHAEAEDDVSPPNRQLAEKLVTMLNEAKIAAWHAGDYYTALMTVNDVAQIYRDTENYYDALQTISDSLDAVESWHRLPGSPLSNMAKTTGSIISLTEGDLRARAVSIIDRLDRLQESM